MTAKGNSATGNSLDSLDRKILGIIQSGFPLEPHPYSVIGEQVGLTGAEVLARVRALRESGVIRRLGASFQSRQLGWRSTLCAAKVPAEKIEAFTAEVNRHPGVTHNYLRDNPYNVWFTCIGPGWDAVCATLAEISERTGVEILNLPAKKMYKIKVDFPMEED